MNTLLFYLIIELLAIFFLYYGLKKEKGMKRNIFICFSALLLILLIGLRSVSTGTDTKYYVGVFNRYVNGLLTNNDKDWIGKGYFLIFWIVKNVFDAKYVFLNFLVGTLTITFFYKSILENSKKPCLSLFLFFSTCLFLQSLNQSRQILAIVMVLYSYKYIKSNMPIKYFITIFLAGMIHASAFIMLPFYYIGKIKINKKSFAFYTIIILIILFGFDYIQKLLLLTSYGKIYIGNDYMVDSHMSSYLNLMVRAALLIFVFYFSNKKSRKDDTFLYNMAIWTFITQLVTIRMYIFGRITTYFFIFYILLIPNFIESIESKSKKKLCKYLSIILFFMYHVVYYLFVSGESGYDVYHFFWQ